MTIHKRLTTKEISPSYWRVVIENPPINLYDPEMFAELRVLMDRIEADKELKVISLRKREPGLFRCPLRPRTRRGYS